MSLLSALGVSSSGLLAQQSAARTVANNIANASTPGYHRQDVAFKSVTGGIDTATNRASNAHLQKRLYQQQSVQAQTERRSQGLQEIEGLVGELGENGLTARLDDLFAGFRALAASPQDLALRSDVLQRAERLAQGVVGFSDSVVAQGVALEQEIVTAVDDINRLLTTIVSLSQSIGQAQAGSANELRDQRDLAVNELSTRVDVRVQDDGAGSYQVFVANGVLVADGAQRRLVTTEVDAAGRHQVRVESATEIPLAGRLSGGSLRALLQLRDTDLPKYQQTIDQFAADLKDGFNGVHQTLFDLQGAAGTDLFALDAAGSASSLRAVITDPQKVAVSAGGARGDSAGVAALLQLEDDAVASGGSKTLRQALQDFVIDVGFTTKLARGEAESAEARAVELGSFYDAVTGVSLEEQMMWLSRFQRASQAASQVLRTVDEMFEDVLGMKR